jgi:hypothetical protein
VMPRIWLVIVVLQGLLMLGFWISRIAS